MRGEIWFYPVPPVGGQHGLALLNSCGRLRLLRLSKLVDFHPLPISRLCPEWVQLLVWGSSSHGNEGEEWKKHLVATYRGMMVRATLATLNTHQAGELRIVQVVVAGNGETNLPIIEPPCKLTDSSPFRGAKNDDRKSTGSIISREIFVKHL